MKKRVLWIMGIPVLVIAICVAVLFCYAQSGDSEVLIESGVTKWRYTVMTADQFSRYSRNWTQMSGAPMGWKSGVSPFGDRINPDNNTNWRDDRHVLLLATTFRISDLESAKKKEFVAHIYYDNTVTVYLNGQQVFHDVGWVDDYVDLTLDFSSALVSGNNTLALSVEDDTGGRELDMTLIMRNASGEQSGQDPTPPFTLSADEGQLTATGLSTLYIDTANGDYVQSRLNYTDANLRISLSKDDAGSTNAYTGQSGAGIRIKGRGNSTWNNGYPDGKMNTLPGDTHTRKVPYTLKLDEKADLFGMGSSKHWTLIANYMDRSMLRNKLIYDLSGRMGLIFCKSTYVNLVLNGEYMGVYALTQKIDPELFGGQVTDWEEIAEDFAKAVAKKNGFSESWRDSFEARLCADLSWLTQPRFEGYPVADYVDLSKYSTKTGFLIEYDGYADEDSFFTTAHGVPLKVSNMEAIKTNPAVFQSLKSYFDDFEEALFSENFVNSKGKHYSEYVDMDSLVDYFILNTVILNLEFGYKSMYFYINGQGKIVMGPCWDYDWSSGNLFLGANGQFDQWYNDGRAENNRWYREMYGDPCFVALVRERWAQLSDALDDTVDSIRVYQERLQAAENLEYAKFSADPYESDFAWRTGGRSFAEECQQLQDFLINRIDWLNRQFAQKEPNIEGRGMSASAALNLSLSGEGLTGGSFADYTLSRLNALTLNLTSTRQGSAQIWLNGEKLGEIAVQRNRTQTLAIPGDSFRAGVNTVTVFLRDTGGQYWANALSLQAPGLARAAPERGSYTEGYGGRTNPPPTSVKPSPTSDIPQQTSRLPTTAGASKPNASSTPIASPDTSRIPETSANRPPRTDENSRPGSGESSDRPTTVSGSFEAATTAPAKTPTPTGGSVPIDPVTPSDPGEDGLISSPFLWIGLGGVILAAAGIAGILVWRKKKK